MDKEIPEMEKELTEGALFIKDQLDDGYLGTSNTHTSLLVFFIGSAISVGVASFAVFAENTNIGWDGLSPFWQGVFIAEAILMTIQLIMFISIRKETNVNQLMLVTGYLVYSVKIGFDFYLTYAMFLMDADLYDSWKYVYFSLFFFGFVVLIISIYYVRYVNLKKYKAKYLNEDSDEAEGASKKKGVKWTASFYIILPLVLISGAIMDKTSYYGELIFLLMIITVVYYTLMSHAMIPVYALYFWFKYPSFRIEAIRKEKENSIMEEL